MKHLFIHLASIKWPALFFVLSVFALSCTDTPAPDVPPLIEDPITEDPDDDPAETAITYEQLTGKWLIGDLSLANGRKANARVSLSASTGMGPGLLGGKRTDGENNRVVEEGEYPAFLEFLPDSTYILFDGYMGFYRGKVNNSNASYLVLEGFGTVENFSLSEERLVFELVPENSENRISIEAIKTEPYELDERTALLSSRDWIVDEAYTGSDEDGAVEYNVEVTLEYWDGTLVTGILETSGDVFTSSGTYFAYAVVDGKIHLLDTTVWKWLSDNLIQYQDWSNIDRVEELTDQRLVLVDEEELNGVLYEYKRRIFKASDPYFED